MTEQEIKQLVAHVLGDIAPEADLAELDPDEDFREQLDIDSMDFQNFVEALYTELGTDIPEVDYPKLSSVNGCVAYLLAKTG